MHETANYSVFSHCQVYTLAFMKRLALFGYGLITFGNPCYATEPPNTDDASLVCIESVLDNNKTNVGTGFFIAPGIIATVQHQIKDAKKVLIHRGNRSENAKTILQAHEVAILSVADTATPALLLDNDLPHKGAKVFTYRCQADKQQHLFPVQSALGSVTVPQRHNDADNYAFIEAELPIQKGNSGAPLLGEDHHVLGIVDGYDDLKKDLSVSVPTTALIELIMQEKTIPFKELLLLQGERYFKQKDFYHAQKRFELAIHVQPDYYNAYIYLANTLFMLGNFSAARDILHQAIVIDSKNPAAYAFLAGVSLKLSDDISQRNALQQSVALEKDPLASEKLQNQLQAVENALAAKQPTH